MLPTIHPGTGRQLDHQQICQQTNQTAEIQINGYAILLDPGLRRAETIQRLLVPRTNKSS
jgi:hypothetical protein